MHAEFEKLLKDAIGLDAASIGASSIERAVQQRLRACKSENLRDYWEFVSVSETERQELIEAVVVPETWFFRDREAFAALARLVQDDDLASRAQAPLRILSLPSSTGEEAYSIVMALFDSGLAPGQFYVDAVDISRPALAQADHAVYRKNSFRGNDLDFRERYFAATAHGYRLSDRVHQQVRFRHGNLFATDVFADVESYDIVFCRNLLIYFDQATQDRALQILSGLMTSRGVLFVAPSETGLLLARDFISVNMPLSFAFRKGRPNGGKKRAETGAPYQLAKLIPQQSSKLAASRKPVAAFLQRTPATSIAQRKDIAREECKDDIEEAVRLADQGRLVEAANCCQGHLRKNGPSAAAFHLLGLVRDATGNYAEASDCYRKALYLDPDHHEALIHLAFMMEKEGDTVGARTLRERARRLEQKRKA